MLQKIFISKESRLSFTVHTKVPISTLRTYGKRYTTSPRDTVLGTGTNLIEATKVGGMGNTTIRGKKAESKK
jgi:hypothetical protein